MNYPFNYAYKIEIQGLEHIAAMDCPCRKVLPPLKKQAAVSPWGKNFPLSGSNTVKNTMRGKYPARGARDN
jgi:hypothetical protein